MLYLWNLIFSNKSSDVFRLIIPLQLLHHVVFTCNRKIQLISISYKYTRHIERVERWEANHEFIDIHEGHLGNDGALFNYWTPSNQSNSEQIWVVKGFLKLRGENCEEEMVNILCRIQCNLFQTVCSERFLHLNLASTNSRNE